MGAKLLLLLVLAALLVAGTSAQACSYGGLSETYYANVNLQPPAVLTRFGYPRYNWGFGSPATGIVPPNNFSLYIAGQITPPETGTYRFRPYSDDGLRLYINGVLTCEAWSQRSYNVVPCTRNWNLVAGVPFDVVITYFEILETARFDLNWILPSNAGTLTITAPANSSYGFSNCTTKELLVTTPVQVSNEVASLQIKLSSKPNLNVTVTAESTCMNFDACLVNIINNNFNLTHTLRGLFKDANQQCCNVTLKATEGDADYLGQTKTVQVCKGASNPSSAISFGDPHMTTFDGAKYDTFALGEFYFVRKIEGDFAVQTRQARCGRASCNSGVAVRYRNTTFYVYLNDFVSSTPQVVTVNNPADGVSITDLGNKFIFTTPLGITVNVVVDKWHGRNSFYLNVKVTAGSAFYNHLYGLAGKFDGTSSNDMTRPDGQLAVSTSNFVTSWAIGTASENLFTSPSAVIPALYPGGVPIVTNASFTPACCGNCSVPVPPAVCTSNCSIPQCTSCVCTSDCEPDCTVFSTQAFKDQATASCNQFFNNDAAKCCAPLLSNATYLATCMCDYNLAQGTGFEKASLDAYLAECEVIRTRLNYVCPTCECDACAPAPCTPEPPVVVTVGPISISRSCPAAYSPLTVQGSGFPKTGSVQCSFNGGSPTTATVVTAYKLTCPLPASIPAGTESLVVRVVVNGVASNSSAIVSFVTTCCDAPCKNGATCVPNGLEDYTCNCVAPYSGKNCDAQCAINPTPNITFTTGQVNKTIQVVLSAAPGAPVTVSLTSDCVNLEKCALVFTTSNWNVPQTVQVSLNAANAAAVCAINLVSNSTGLCGNKTASTLITKGQLERAQANAYGDPHITGYDRVTLDFFGKGDYTLTRTLAGEYAIQVRNEACGAGSCIYKAAVKFYDVVYTIQITSAGVPSAQLVGVPSARGVVITNPTPKVFMMDTTTGITTKVNVGSYLFKGKDTYYLSVSVKLPSSYAGLMAGQFGNFDGNKNNELTLPNGQAAPTESSFHLSWAVPSAENLILNPYATVSPIRGAVVPTLSSSASCFQPPNPDPLPPAPNVINCTATPNDPACKPIVPDAGPTCSSPNATQLAQAKAACDPLFNSTDAQCCHNNGYPGDSYYSSCLCDMILTGEPSFALVDYLTYIEACKQDLANRKITACKPCPNSCSGVGTCSNGVCQCPPNYEGEDCSINFNEPPVPETPSPLSVGKGCGETLTVYGSKFFGTDLKCLFDGSVQVAATKVSDYELRCTVPSFGPAVTQVSVHVIRRAVTSTASVTLSLHASCCSSPCQNGATCVGGNGPSVSCTCAPGFGGTNCEFSACPKTASRNGTLGPVPLSTSGNVHCPPGHVLKALTTCSGTTFGTYKVTCAPVTSFCPESIFSHAVFPKTPAGEPSMGTCEAGFVGTPVRNCLHNGNWGSTIFSGCQPLTCSADSSDAGIFAQTQASVTASGTCGAGFTGAPTRQCLIDGTWGPIVNPCTVLLTCSSDTYGTATFPATNGGLIATGQCAAGFEGTPKRECKVDGTWSANVQNPCTRIVCPLLDSASTTYDATFAGDLKAGTCKAGYAGAPMRQCNLDGSWSAETGTACVIVPPTCAGATYGSATFPTTLSGTYATGTCAAGFAGTPKRECLANGQWSSTVQNLCQRTTCPPLDDGFATYGALPTGSLHTGTCKAGFAGSPIRECLVNGNLEGTWGAVKNQCQAAVSQCPAVSGTSFYANANWAATPAGQYATGTCKAGYSGAPKRLCQETGSWSGNVLNHCQRLSCPGVTFENAVYVTTLTSEFRVGTCEAGFSGSPSRYCQADQTWSAPKGTPCTPVVAP